MLSRLSFRQLKNLSFTVYRSSSKYHKQVQSYIIFSKIISFLCKNRFLFLYFMYSTSGVPAFCHFCLNNIIFYCLGNEVELQSSL